MQHWPVNRHNDKIHDETNLKQDVVQGEQSMWSTGLGSFQHSDKVECCDYHGPIRKEHHESVRIVQVYNKQNVVDVCKQ